MYPDSRLKRTHFVLRGKLGPYPGWSDGSAWGAWACPLFNFETALRICSDYNELQPLEPDHPHEAYYDGEADIFYFTDPALNDEKLAFTGVMKDGRKVYPIGARVWSWQEHGGAGRNGSDRLHSHERERG
jgi:hypothetical protein